MEQNGEAQRAQNHAQNPPQNAPLDGNQLPTVATCCVCASDLHTHPDGPHRAHRSNQFILTCPHHLCCECAVNTYVHSCVLNPYNARINQVICPLCRVTTPVRPSYFIRLFNSSPDIPHQVNMLTRLQARIEEDRNERNPIMNPGARALLLQRLAELLTLLNTNNIAALGRLNNGHGPVAPSTTPLLLIQPPPVVPPPQPPQVVVEPQVQEAAALPPPPPPLPELNVPAEAVQVPHPPPIEQNAPAIAPMVINPPRVNIPEALPLLPPLPPNVVPPPPDEDDAAQEFFETYSPVTYTTVYTLRNVFDVFPWNLSLNNHLIIYLSIILSVFHPLYAIPVVLCNIAVTKESLIAFLKLTLIFVVMSFFTLPAFIDELSPSEIRVDVYAVLTRMFVILKACFKYYLLIVNTHKFTYVYCSGVLLMYITPLLRIGSASNHGMIKPHEHDLIGLPVWLPNIDYQDVGLLGISLPVVRFAHMPPKIDGALEYSGHVNVAIYEQIYLKLINNRYANVPTSELLRYIAGDVANLFLENKCTMSAFDPMKLLYTQFAIYQAVLTVRSCEREITVTPTISSIRDIQW